MPSARIVARLDPTLSATVVRRTPMAYADSAAEGDDRPPFVRAASGIVVAAGVLVVVQDDTSFVAVADASGRALSIALPRGPGDRRRFESRLGNKNDKLDLEACFAVGRRVVAFGSGSLAAREKVVVIDLDGKGDDAARVHDASGLFAWLRDAWQLAPEEINLEGAALHGDRVVLFQRGNGAGTAYGPATASLPATEFMAWLDGTEPIPPPVLEIARYDLGSLHGATFGFTDATSHAGALWFLAGAEHSPSTVDDGEVTGSRLGVLDGTDARVADLVDEGGTPLAIKAEGIAFDPSRPDIAFVVLDEDDPDRPSDLCEIRLAGPWRPSADGA